MVYKKLFAVLILLLISVGVGATETVSTQTINQSMAKIGAVMLDIYPLIVARREMSKDEHLVLLNALNKINRLFVSVAPQIRAKSDAYQITYDFVLEYLKITRFVFNSGDLDYARGHLYALGEICSACHTQDTKLRTLFSGTSRKKFSDDFAFAEFNYFTRNYDEAIKYYNKHLNSRGRKTELEIIQPLQRLVTIFTQIKNQPGEGVKVLRNYQKLSNHSKETAQQLSYWIDGLQQLERTEQKQKTEITFSGLEQKVAKYLGDLDKISIEMESTAQNEIYHVWLRGQLYHYLNRHDQGDNQNVAKILYWLAIIDRSIAHNFYFSQSVLYLKQCVLHYPRQAIARRCLDDYVTYINFTYRRSGEKELPPEIQQEMQQLQRAIPAGPREIPS